MSYPKYFGKLRLNAGCGSDTWGDIRIDNDPEAKAATDIMDITEMDFNDKIFYETRCISVLEHIRNWRKAVKELCRVTDHKLIIEVPVNSNLLRTDFFRIFFPIPENIKLLISLKKRAQGTLWQFKPEILAKEIEKNSFNVSWRRIIKIYHALISRSYQFMAIRRY